MANGVPCAVIFGEIVIFSLLALLSFFPGGTITRGLRIFANSLDMLGALGIQRLVELDPFKPGTDFVVEEKPPCGTVH